MAAKNAPAQFDCYAHAKPDEPMFVLLARDADAPKRVRDWARVREMAIDGGEKPESDRAMVDEARRCASDMEAWRAANWPHRKNDGTEAAPRGDADKIGGTATMLVEITAGGDNENTPAEAIHHGLAAAQKAGFIKSWSEAGEAGK